MSADARRSGPAAAAELRAASRTGRAAAATLLFLAAGARLAADGGGGGAAPPLPTRGGTVVLVSLDGVRHDDPSRAGAVTLARMAREGASADRLLPPFPSTTFAAHATLATGVPPDRHGIVGNEFLDRERGPFRREDDPSWLLAEPVWVTAERQGASAAVCQWPCSDGTWHGVAASIHAPFDPGLADSAVVDRVLGWLRTPAAAKPRLILAYLHGSDAAGHRDGPGSAGALARLRAVDQQLGRLLRGIAEARPSATLLVVSDHGMAPVRHVIRLGARLRGRGRAARVFAGGAVANLYCPSSAVCEEARSDLLAIPGVALFGQTEIPPALRYRLPARIGDLVAIAPPGAYFEGGREGGGDAPARGMHGWPPDRPGMAGIFYAWGAGLRAGARVRVLNAVDIEPLVCRLVGIDPPAGVEGRIPEAILERFTPRASPRGPDPDGTR